jgi:hypothetical protein
MYFGLRMKDPLSLPDLNETNFLDSFEKKINYPKNATSGSRIVPCGHSDGQTDLAKLYAILRTRLRTDYGRQVYG